MTEHNALIERLGRAARPVRRPRRTAWRALSWTLTALPCGWLASLLVPREATDWAQPGTPLAALQLLLAFICGYLALRNALVISIAGRRPLGWRTFAPLLLIWGATLLFSIGHAPLTGRTLSETRCYAFMLTVSAPMLVLAIVWIRQTRTLTPLRSLTAAGCGVGCMALTLLSFCHPLHLHPWDLAMHGAAFATIVAATVLLGWRWVSVT